MLTYASVVSSLQLFFFNDTATTEIYTLSLHDALPILAGGRGRALPSPKRGSGRRSAGQPVARLSLPTSPSPAARFLRSEEHTSELQSRQYLVCRLLLEKKNKTLLPDARSVQSPHSIVY